MMMTKINFVALAAGISSFILIAISMFIPWWQLTIGSPANVQVNFSPVNFALMHSGSSIYIPLVFALNLACLLTMIAGAVILTIYSVKPAASYSKRLLGFGYTKPVITVVAFAAILIAIPLMVQAFVGFSLPIAGTAFVSPPGANGGANVSAAIEWPFYFAIAVAGLCIASRLIHGRIVKTSISPPPA